MRSRRSRFELACRVGAFGALGWLLGGSLIPSSGRRLDRATSNDVASRLAAWTRAPRRVALHGDFATTTPDAWAIDWLAALRHSGHAVSWSGAPPSVAMSSDAVREPDGGIRVDVAAPQGAVIALRDDGGVIDTLRVASLGGSVATPIAIGPIIGHVGGQRFSAASPDSARLRAIVVIGGASWEGKFIAAALEERGWPVIARFAVAPGVDVASSGPLTLDTSRVAAVVAIDTTSVQSLGAALERFVRSGGGLVLAGPSSLAPSLASLRPGTLGARLRPAVQAADTIGLGTTGFYPVTSLAVNGVALDRRAGGVPLAARRIGAGRVVQVGYDDSWRWRMAGAPGSEEMHRAWWSRVVGSVAYVPAAASSTTGTGDAAPVARLASALGVAHAVSPGQFGRAPIDTRIYLTLIMVLLLVECASRRWRGLR